MAAEVNFCLFLNVLFCLACNTVPENWHICAHKGLTYLQINLKSSFLRSIGDEKRVGSKSRSPFPTDASNGFGNDTLPSVINQLASPELLFRLIPMYSLFYGCVQKRSVGLSCISRWYLFDDLKTILTKFPSSHGARKWVTCASNGRIHCNLQPSLRFFPIQANKNYLFLSKTCSPRLTVIELTLPVSLSKLFKSFVICVIINVNAHRCIA